MLQVFSKCNLVLYYYSLSLIPPVSYVLYKDTRDDSCGNCCFDSAPCSILIEGIRCSRFEAVEVRADRRSLSGPEPYSSGNGADSLSWLTDVCPCVLSGCSGFWLGSPASLLGCSGWTPSFFRNVIRPGASVSSMRAVAFSLGVVGKLTIQSSAIERCFDWKRLLSSDFLAGGMLSGLIFTICLPLLFSLPLAVAAPAFAFAAASRLLSCACFSRAISSFSQCVIALRRR